MERALVPARILLWVAGAAVPAAGLGLLALSAEAQEGGTQLTFGVSQRLEAIANAELDADSRGTTRQASTSLSFNAVTQTRLDRLAFGASGALRVVDDPAGGTRFEADTPRLSFSYGRETPAARLALRASYSETEIEFLRLEDLLDPDVILTPEDIENLRGTGTRRNLSATASLDWGLDDPLGFGLTATVNRLRYSDTGGDLFDSDSDRESLSARTRLRLSPVLDATASLGFSRFDDTDPANDPRDTTSLDLGLALDRPLGALTADLSATDTADGTRLGFAIGRSYALPAGRLSASLGLTRAAEGETALTGSLDWRQDLPQGAAVTARVERNVTSGTDDTDRVVTLASIGYDRPLGAAGSLGLDLSFLDSRTPATGDSVSDASLRATYSRALTPDWALDLGLTRRLRDSDSAGRADSTAAFVTLGRSFDFRP